jgi:Cu/Zn superoxide dismutase
LHLLAYATLKVRLFRRRQRSKRVLVAIGIASVVGTTSGSALNGFVGFYDNGDGTVTVRVNVTGVSPVSQDHGIHIHEVSFTIESLCKLNVIFSLEIY